MDEFPTFRPYGNGDNSYRAAGGLAGISRLVDDFYDFIDSVPEAAKIRTWHKPDLGLARLRLTWFLSGWLGGEKLYQKHLGGISIPAFHHKFPIGMGERDAWLICMKYAIDRQPYPQDFKLYLLEQLSVPAERSRSKRDVNGN